MLSIMLEIFSETQIEFIMQFTLQDVNTQQPIERLSCRCSSAFGIYQFQTAIDARQQHICPAAEILHEDVERRRRSVRRCVIISVYR